MSLIQDFSLLGMVCGCKSSMAGCSSLLSPWEGGLVLPLLPVEPGVPSCRGNLSRPLARPSGSGWEHSSAVLEYRHHTARARFPPSLVTAKDTN